MAARNPIFRGDLNGIKEDADFLRGMLGDVYLSAWQLGIGEALAVLATDESEAAGVGLEIIRRMIQKLRDAKPKVEIPKQLNGGM